jgi:hypothetical protein
MRVKKHLLIPSALAAILSLGFSPAFAQVAPRPVSSAGQVKLAADAGQCAFSKNPYSVPRSLLAACGYRFIDRSYTAKLRGGGTSYVYYLAGHKVMYNVPPKGFNVRTATHRQLREYNIPSRGLLGGTRNWNRIMGQVRFAAPPAVLIEGPKPFYIHNDHWSGYVDTGHSNYNEVGVDFTEPHIGSSVCSSDAEGTWVGIGGYTTGTLSQDGTAYGTGHPHGAWWEVLPAGPVYSSWNGSAGDTIDATTTWDTTTNRWGFAVIDGSHILNPAEQGGGYDGSSAEFITERPGGFNLSNFGTIPFTNAYSYYGSTGRHGVGQLSHTEIRMWDGSRNMATPSSISGSNSQKFSITQNHCN